jgi:uncharacterized repeat protein (TIGR03803 family)
MFSREPRSFFCRSGPRRFRTYICLLALSSVAAFARAQICEVVHSFSGQDGANPTGGLVCGADGALYGTTTVGGTADAGTIFRIASNGDFSTIASFNWTNGSSPYPGLTLASDGNLYGVTTFGPAAYQSYGQGCGTVFRVATNGVLTTLAVFGQTNGCHPYVPLIQAADGDLYGTTHDAGPSGARYGNIFQASTNGALRNLLTFDMLNGDSPQGPLVLGPDGAIYGVTEWGGTPLPDGSCAYGCGTAFRITTGGVSRVSPAVFGGSNAAPNPQTLMLADDGDFYGTTDLTIFRMALSGDLTRFASFNGWNGYKPLGPLVQASDHFLYGTTWQGGSYSVGNVFRVNWAGLIENLVSFDGTNGGYPVSGLTLAKDGSLYGVTKWGGPSNQGTVFRISFPLLELHTFANQLILSWSTNLAGSTLEWTPVLTSGDWTATTNSLVALGDQFWVTNPMTLPSQFFRLRR